VDPVPDPLLLRKSGSVGNRTRTSGSVAARPLDHRGSHLPNIQKANLNNNIKHNSFPSKQMIRLHKLKITLCMTWILYHSDWTLQELRLGLVGLKATSQS
jgi:hypothetical protein